MGFDKGTTVVNVKTHKIGVIQDWSDLQPAGVGPSIFGFSVLVDGNIEFWPASDTADWKGKSSIVPITNSAELNTLNKVDDIVFISCGQSSNEERALGEKIYDLIKHQTPYKPYYADKQTSLKGLTDNIFNQLNKCVGLVAVLHKRNPIEEAADRNEYRTSVWIEQEIAIASFIEQVLGRPIGVFLYAEKGIKLEGVRKYIQLNSTVEFIDEAEILDDLIKKINDGDFKFSISDSKETSPKPILSDVQFVNEFLKLKVLRIELLMTSPNYDFRLVNEVFQSLKNTIHVTFGEGELKQYSSSPGIEPKQETTSCWVSLTRMREYLIGSLIGQFNAKKLDASFKRVELPQYEDKPIIVRVFTPQKEYYEIQGRNKRRIFANDLKKAGIHGEDDPNVLNVNPQELPKYQDA